jgi:hypothetical protein
MRQFSLVCEKQSEILRFVYSGNIVRNFCQQYVLFFTSTHPAKTFTLMVIKIFSYVESEKTIAWLLSP